MAIVLNYNGRQTGLSPDYQAPEGVVLQFNTNLVQSQIDAGVAGKVTILHPAFSTRATIFKNRNGRAGYHVMAASTNIGREGRDNFFNIVQLENDFRLYIVEEFKKFLQNQDTARPAWYLSALGEHQPIAVTTEESNEALGIDQILLNTELTEGQVDAGMACKVTLKTNIGDVRGLSVYRSRFGQSLYSVAQNEDEENSIPAYRLSREAEAQVLNFIHPLVTEWGDAPAQRPRQSRRQAPAVGTVATAVDGAQAGTGAPVTGGSVQSEAEVYND